MTPKFPKCTREHVILFESSSVFIWMVVERRKLPYSCRQVYLSVDTKPTSYQYIYCKSHVCHSVIVLTYCVSETHSTIVMWLFFFGMHKYHTCSISCNCCETHTRGHSREVGRHPMLEKVNGPREEVTIKHPDSVGKYMKVVNITEYDLKCTAKHVDLQTSRGMCLKSSHRLTYISDETSESTVSRSCCTDGHPPFFLKSCIWALLWYVTRN